MFIFKKNPLKVLKCISKLYLNKKILTKQSYNN